jgi:hypothetical protein
MSRGRRDIEGELMAAERALRTVWRLLSSEREVLESLHPESHEKAARAMATFQDTWLLLETWHGYGKGELRTVCVDPTFANWTFAEEEAEEAHAPEAREEER